MKKVKINGVIYGVRDSEVVVCGVVDKNYPADIRIEYEVQGKPVVQIRSGAFEFKDIKSIEMPSTINTISKGAFFCMSLLRTSF